MQVTKSNLDRCIALIKPCVLFVLAELVFSMDESGLSDWEQQRPKHVLVSSDAGDARLHCPVDRGIRYQTLQCCVSASGDAYYPLSLTAYRQARLALDKAFEEALMSRLKFAILSKLCEITRHRRSGNLRNRRGIG